MRCSQCGAKTAGLVCPKCGNKPSDFTYFFSGFRDVFGGGLNYGPLRRATRRLFGRMSGAYPRLLAGKYWEPGEHELYRSNLQAVNKFAVDHHDMILSGATCFITNHRLIACSPGSQPVEIGLGDIAQVHIIRDLDSEGSPCLVAIALKCSREPHPEGDLSLRCGTLHEGRELETRIKNAAGLA